MIKKISKVLSLLLGGAVMLTAGACTTKPRGNNGSIDVSYYKGGTGSEWIEELAESFEEKTGIQVNLKSDNNITVNARVQLEAGRNLSDIMFVQYTNWHEYVQQGWVEPIDDLYDGTFTYTADDYTISSEYNASGLVSDFKANDGKSLDKVTLYDTLVSDFRDYGKMSKTINEEPHFWVVPWTCPTTSLAYNVDILKEAGWDNPPATEQELFECIEDINKLGKYSIFSWGGTELGYWDFITLTWWAQYDGVETQHSFYQFESADVFKQQGRIEALKLWQELLVNDDGSWKNSIDKPMGRDHLNAEQQFAQKLAAFTISGAWLENEIREIIDDDFNFKMMSVPMIDGAKAEKPIINTEAGSFAVIPSGAANKEKAKAFLAYMNSPEWVEKFTMTSGQLRPFNYSPSKLSGLSDYNKSVYELYETCDHMWRISDSPLFTYAGVKEWPYYGSASLYGNLSGNNKLTPEAVNAQMYNYAQSQWNTWSKAAGMG